jgi:MSHA pilin protein MshC
MRTAHRNSGFTLIELVTTLVLIGVLAAVAAPRFADNRAFDQRGYADELAAGLRYAQRLAIASNCDVSFGIAANQYSAFQRNVQATCKTAGAWTRPVLRLDGSALAGVAPAGVVATAATFQFRPDGTLTINNPPDVAVGPFQLSVDPTTGSVSVTVP